MDAIATCRLTKHYGRQVALRDLDLRVAEGRLFGFLGPNGAGKTTALRLMLGLLRPTHGRAEVLGRDAWRQGPALRRAVGHLPGDVRLYPHLTGAATLEFFNAVRRADAGPEIRRLTQLLDLDVRRRVRDYSRGMKQKLGLIIAMMHRPRLLILDEPTTSLDPLMRETLYGELRRVVAEGRTVLFSSHTLSEVETLCDEIAILRNGRLIEQERVEVLRQRALRHVEVRLGPGRSPGTPPPAGLEVSHQGDGYLRATWKGPVQPLLDWLARCDVSDATIAPPDLDDLFLAYYAEASAGRTP